MARHELPKGKPTASVMRHEAAQTRGKALGEDFVQYSHATRGADERAMFSIEVPGRSAYKAG